MCAALNGDLAPREAFPEQQPIGHVVESSWTMDVYDALAEDDSLTGFLAKVADLATSMFTDHGSCGVSLAATKRRHWVHAGSDDFAARLDVIQHSVDEGPSIEVLATGRSWSVDDVNTEHRWPTFMIPARLHGLASVLSSPLVLRSGATVGALTMYSPHIDAYSSEDRRRLSAFTASLSAPLAVAVRLSEHRQNSKDLRYALATRGSIGQAVGIIMARNDCTAETAFAILRGASRDSNRKLRDLAADTVESVAGQRPDVNFSSGSAAAD